MILTEREKNLIEYLLKKEIETFGDYETNLLRIEYKNLLEKVV